MSAHANNWYAVKVEVARTAVEPAESALLELGAAGTQFDGLRRTDNEPAVVAGFFEEPPDTATVADAVQIEMSYYGISPDDLHSISVERVEEQDWLAGWKSHWQPTAAGRFVITPPWIEPETDSIVIKIEPNMAFGTGTHETTQLCLEWMGDVVSCGSTVLDVGTGTGILSIAAAKLGANVTLACDTDEPSIAIAIENAAMNGVRDRCRFEARTLSYSDASADVVFANLTLDVIEPLLPMLIEKADRELVLSGILTEQRDEIVAALRRNGVANETIAVKGQWIAVRVQF